MKHRNIKVCPVVTRLSGTNFQVLLFRHSLAGVQLVKGTLEESDESYETASLRELMKNLE